MPLQSMIKVMINKDLVIIGAGPAGLAAAVEAKAQGIKDVLLIERDGRTGGILNQCIHDGFGVIRFSEALSGPEYAARYYDMFKESGAELAADTMVLSITPDKIITAVGKNGIVKYQAKAIILAMGCRERTRGAIAVPGSRPAGIFTAGVAQNFVNLKNINVGKKILILGSGDIGLIMARRLTLEGAEVIAVLEKLPYSSGLPRNITQCLEDYNIPLYLSRTVVNIHGQDRLTGVTTASVDYKGNVIKGTEEYVECDTLILSVGLIPENELTIGAGIEMDPVTGGALVDESMMTSADGIFACGNALHVHDLVDFVSEESAAAAKGAAEYIESGKRRESSVNVINGDGIRYVLPRKISCERDVTISMRVARPDRNRYIAIYAGDELVKKEKHVKLNPAEMIRIKLDAKSIENAKETGLEVRIIG